MCGGENWLLIVLVLSVKKVAKSSAVIEVVGGGGGGQRRELNVEIPGVFPVFQRKFKVRKLLK